MDDIEANNSDSNNTARKIDKALTLSVGVRRISNLKQDKKSIEKDKSAKNMTIDRINEIISNFLMND